MNRFFYRCGSETLGPVTAPVIRQLAADGVITPETQVQRESGGAWIRAKKIPGLQFEPDSVAVALSSPLTETVSDVSRESVFDWLESDSQPPASGLHFDPNDTLADEVIPDLGMADLAPVDTFSPVTKQPSKSHTRHSAIPKEPTARRYRFLRFLRGCLWVIGGIALSAGLVSLVVMVIGWATRGTAAPGAILGYVTSVFVFFGAGIMSFVFAAVISVLLDVEQHARASRRALECMADNHEDARVPGSRQNA